MAVGRCAWLAWSVVLGVFLLAPWQVSAGEPRPSVIIPDVDPGRVIEPAAKLRAKAVYDETLAWVQAQWFADALPKAREVYAIYPSARTTLFLSDVLDALDRRCGCFAALLAARELDASGRFGKQIAEEPAPPLVEAAEEPASATEDLGWILLGLGAATLVGGGVMTLLALDAKEEQSSAAEQYDKSGSVEDYNRLKGARDRASTRQTLSIALYAAGAASGTAGILVLTVADKGDNAAFQLRALAGPTSIGLSLGGSF